MSITSGFIRAGVYVVETQDVLTATGQNNLIRKVQFRLRYSSGGQTTQYERAWAMQSPVSASTYDTETEILGRLFSSVEFGPQRLEGFRVAAARLLKRKIEDAANSVVYFQGS